MASVTATEMRKIAELLEATMVQTDVLNRQNKNSEMNENRYASRHPEEYERTANQNCNMPAENDITWLDAADQLRDDVTKLAEILIIKNRMSPKDAFASIIGDLSGGSYNDYSAEQVEEIIDGNLDAPDNEIWINIANMINTEDSIDNQYTDAEMMRNISNSVTQESITEDDDNMMDTNEIQQYQQDMNERADDIQEASFMIMKAARMISKAVKGTEEEDRAISYIVRTLTNMATSSDRDRDNFTSIPVLINKLRNR